MDDRELIGYALSAREKTHSVYSGVAVGAALLAESGEVYIGANIENASYPATVCAERVAFFSALMKGERKFKKIAVAGGLWGKRSGSREGKRQVGLYQPGRTDGDPGSVQSDPAFCGKWPGGGGADGNVGLHRHPGQVC